MTTCWLRGSRTSGNKKADVVEHPKALNHTGLLANGPPCTAGLLFV
jgi:hypothetical protein